MSKILRIMSLIVVIVLFTVFSLGLTSIKVDSIKCNTKNVTLLTKATYTLRVVITPDNATNKKLTFLSSNRKVASVDKNGKIKAIIPGKTIITITSASNKKAVAKCTVTVTNSLPEISYMHPPYPGQTIYDSTYSVVEWGKRVGAKIRIIGIPMETFKEKVTTSISSGNMPDIINFYQDAITFNLYGSRLFAAIDDYFGTGAVSNYERWMKELPTIRQFTKNANDNKIYGFVSVRDYDYYGPAWYIRNDLLKKKNMDADNLKTVDDIKNALLAVKEVAGHDYIVPYRLGFSFYSGYVAAYFGTGSSVVYDAVNPKATGKYVFGPLQPNYKLFVEFSKWMYENKILHPDFLTMNRDEVFGGWASGKYPVALEQNSIGTYMESRDEPNREVKIIFPPVINGVQYGWTNWNRLNYGYLFPICISKSSKNVEEALKAVDYLYSDEGSSFFLYGDEGRYWVKDGTYPSGRRIVGFQHIHNNNSKSLLTEQELGINNFNLGPVGTIRPEIRYRNLLPGEKESNNSLVNTTIQLKNKGLLYPPVPPILFTTDETKARAQITTPLGTYIEENVVNFILGKKSMSEWDKFIDGLEKFEYKKLVDMYNTKLGK